MSVEEGPGISGMLGMSLWYAAGLAEPFPPVLSCVCVLCLCVCVCGMLGMSLWYAASLAEPFPPVLCQIKYVLVICQRPDWPCLLYTPPSIGSDPKGRHCENLVLNMTRGT